MLDFIKEREDIFKTNRLNDEEMKVIFNLKMAEVNADNGAFIKPIPASEMPFTLAIVQKRIEGLDLPVKMTPGAVILSSIWCTNPGMAVMFLIDCLRAMPNSDEHYKTWLKRKRPETFLEELKKLGLDGETKELEKFEITTDFICESVYPNGKWTEEVMIDYIDNYLKPNKVPWAEIY